MVYALTSLGLCDGPRGRRKRGSEHGKDVEICICQRQVSVNLGPYRPRTVFSKFPTFPKEFTAGQEEQNLLWIFPSVRGASLENRAASPLI